MQFISNSLHSLSLPSLNIYSAVVASTSSKSVLDAMKLMSEEGVSSVAVVEEETGSLLSAVSVTDIGKVSVRITEWYTRLTKVLCIRLWFRHRVIRYSRHH
jgi:predicted transcriptional regulator